SSRSGIPRSRACSWVAEPRPRSKRTCASSSSSCRPASGTSCVPSACCPRTCRCRRGDRRRASPSLGSGARRLPVDDRRGVGAAGLAYDFLVRARELPAALETARAHPGVRFVVDHLAKPPLREGSADAWAEGLAAIARLPNVSCKLSGLVTEADWSGWRREE